MKLTKEKALELIKNFEKEEKNKYWIMHSICVGNTAGVIAKALSLDEEFATTLGYIHDIGKGVGTHETHVVMGYYYIKNLRYDEKYARICLTHSFLNNDTFCTAGGVPKVSPMTENFIKTHKYTIYEKIINLCDLMCTTKVMTVDKRLVDIILRRGAHENTQYHITETYKLKAYFDKKLGHSVYDLIPEIKDNL